MKPHELHHHSKKVDREEMNSVDLRVVVRTLVVAKTAMRRETVATMTDAMEKIIDMSTELAVSRIDLVILIASLKPMLEATDLEVTITLKEVIHINAVIDLQKLPDVTLTDVKTLLNVKAALTGVDVSLVKMTVTSEIIEVVIEKNMCKSTLETRVIITKTSLITVIKTRLTRQIILTISSTITSLIITTGDEVDITKMIEDHHREKEIPSMTLTMQIAVPAPEAEKEITKLIVLSIISRPIVKVVNLINNIINTRIITVVVTGEAVISMIMATVTSEVIETIIVVVATIRSTNIAITTIATVIIRRIRLARTGETDSHPESVTQNLT